MAEEHEVGARFVRIQSELLKPTPEALKIDLGQFFAHVSLPPYQSRMENSPELFQRKQESQPPSAGGMGLKEGCSRHMQPVGYILPITEVCNDELTWYYWNFRIVPSN